MSGHSIACHEGKTKNRENNWSRRNVTRPMSRTLETRQSWAFGVCGSAVSFYIVTSRPESVLQSLFLKSLILGLFIVNSLP